MEGAGAGGSPLSFVVTYLGTVRSVRGGSDALAARPISETLSTGLPGLDRVFTGILPGDNIVWQVDAVEDYRPFVAPFVRGAVARGKRLVYFRFARHPELVPGGSARRSTRSIPKWASKRSPPGFTR